MVLVLRAAKLHELLPPKDEQQRHIIAYTELLRSRLHFELATEVMKACDAELHDALSLITTTTIHSTEVKLKYARGVVPGRVMCAVCQLPAKGLYAWCQGCGHGGHVEHMRGWFAESTECPAGCGHRCQLRLLAPPSVPANQRFQY